MKNEDNIRILTVLHKALRDADVKAVLEPSTEQILLDGRTQGENLVLCPPICVIREGQIKIVRQLVGVQKFGDPTKLAEIPLFEADLADPESIEKLVDFASTRELAEALNAEYLECDTC